jgi:hypothetical protein
MKCNDYYCNKEATKSYKLKNKEKTLYFCDEHYDFAMSLLGAVKKLHDEKIDVT